LDSIIRDDNVKVEFLYNTINKNAMRKVFSWDSSLSDWNEVLYWHQEYYYNDSGYFDHYIGIEVDVLYEYSYNLDNRIIQRLGLIKNDDDEWVSKYKNEYLYDLSGNNIEKIFSVAYYDEWGEEFTWEMNYKTVNTYNESNNIVLNEYFKWKSSMEWRLNFYTTYEYNENDYLTSVILYRNYFDDILLLEKKNYTYYGNGKINSMIHYDSDSEIGMWVETYKFIYDYNNDYSNPNLLYPNEHRNKFIYKTIVLNHMITNIEVFLWDSTIDDWGEGSNRAFYWSEATVDPSFQAICQDVTLNLDDDGNAILLVSQLNNGSSGDIISMSIDNIDFNCDDLGENTVTLSVIDINNYIDTSTATVTVVDSTNPTLITQNLIEYIDDDGNYTVNPMTLVLEATDNCEIVNTITNISTLDCSNVGDNTIVITVVDSSGNETTQIASINLIDSINPIAISQNVQVDLAGNSSVSIIASDVDNGSSDNCGIDTMTINENTFTEIGNYTIDFTVTDNSTNSDSTTTNVEVIDSTVGMNEQEIKGLKIYPNPTTAQITIKANKQIKNVIVSDILGKQIINENPSKTEINLNLNKLTKGLYLITLKTDNNTSVRKLIKD